MELLFPNNWGVEVDNPIDLNPVFWGDCLWWNLSTVVYQMYLEQIGAIGKAKRLAVHLYCYAPGWNGVFTLE